MTYWITCPIKGCGKVIQDWKQFSTKESKEQVERSFRSHLTGKHCLKGEDYQRAYKEAKRRET